MASIDQIKAGWTEQQLAEYTSGKNAALATAESSFSQLDTNGDGNIDKKELATMAAQGMPANIPKAAIEAKISNFLTEFDANDDGMVQKEEWLAYFGKMFDEVICSQI